MADKLPVPVEFTDALVRQIAMDVGKQVVDHIEHAYPAMCEAVAWNSARLSIRNCTHNAVMEAVKAANRGEVELMLKRHDEHRRSMRKMRKAGDAPSPSKHTQDCEWQFEQYPWDCTCGLTAPTRS